MGWANSVDTSAGIITDYTPVLIERRSLKHWQEKRDRKLIRTEYRGLTYSAAQGYADSHTTDTNTTYSVVRANDANGYTLIKTVDSAGAWVQI